MEKKFDLVCFGTERVGEEREKAIRGLAAVLRIEPRQALALLSGQGATLRRGIAESEAKTLRDEFDRLGIRCNYRPSAARPGELELVPIDEEAEASKDIRCPSCNVKVPVVNDAEPPERCPSCGIVFFKHQRLSEEQAERERIRRRVVSAQQIKDQLLRTEVERQAQADRERMLEEQIRRQMGLPKMLRTRNRLLGTASALFIIGAASGVLVGRVFAPTAPPPESAAMGIPAAVAVAPGNVGKGAIGARRGGHEQDPGLQMLETMQAEFPADDRLPEETLAGAEIGVEVTAAVSAAGKTGAALAAREHGPSSTVRSVRSPSLLDVVSATASDSGLSLRRRIGQGAGAVETLGSAALGLSKNGGAVVASALLVEMSRRAEALPQGLERVKALATAAYYRRAAGDRQGGDDAFQRGSHAAGQLSRDVDQGLAFAALALGAARSGESASADELFLRANEDLRKIANSERRLVALCELAEDYGMAGRRAGALGLLDYVGSSMGSLADPARRNQAYLRLAHAYAKIGDPGNGLELAGRINDPALREQALRELAQQSVEAGHLIWGMELAERLRDPGYASIVYAALGQVQSGIRGEQQPAIDAFAKAEKWSRQVAEPAEKLRVLAEIGQSYTLAGKAGDADARFAQARQMAQSLKDAGQRDRAVLQLAELQLDVLSTDEARTTSALIADPAIRAALRLRIGEAERLRGLLQPSPAQLRRCAPIQVTVKTARRRDDEMARRSERRDKS